MRTAEQFVEAIDDNHYDLGSTPPTALSMDCKSQFVLDYMQLLCLRVTQKMIKCWYKKYLFALNNSASLWHIRGSKCLRKFSIECRAKFQRL